MMISESNDDKSKDWSELECMFRLKEFCKHKNVTLPEHVVFMIACFNGFDFNASCREIKRNHNNRLLQLRMEGPLVDQFLETIVFPLPGLKTKDDKSEVLYFRQSRFMPSKKRNQMLMDNFCYVLTDMSRTEERCRNGVVMILNTKGFIDGRNHDEESIALFAQVVQGQLVPVKVTMVLVVGSTTRFQNSWKQIQALLSPSEVKKFQFVSQDKLGDFLMSGYDQYLPDELGGCRYCMELSEDYVDLKVHEESLRED